VRGQSALVLSLCESLLDLAYREAEPLVATQHPEGGLRGILLRRTNR